MHADVCGLQVAQMQQSALQAGGGRGSSKPDLYAPSLVTPEVPNGPILDPKLGYSASLLSESLDGADSSLDDGTTLSVGSHNDNSSCGTPLQDSCAYCEHEPFPKPCAPFGSQDRSPLSAC